MKTPLTSVALLILIANAAIAAPPKRSKPDQLTNARIFGSSDFASKSYNAQWIGEGHTLVRLEPTAEGSADVGIVAYDASDPQWQRRILVAAAELIPAGESKPLPVEGFSFSEDQSRVLIYTNSKRVWRYKTRGDYWVLDRSARVLKQLGGDRPASSLMFAKFSPNGQLVAYVHDKNLYVEDLISGEIRPLTTSQDPHRISGTSDWVNEEELGIRDGFRWSDDSSRIAFWQFDTTGVPQMTMIDNTSGLYPKPIVFPYPKTGQRNSACRVGVVQLSDLETQWLSIPGDPREHYVARMHWAPPAIRGAEQSLVIQHLNRLQNTNRIYAFSTGESKLLLTEQDDAWVDVHDEMFWLSDSHRFSWASERAGWRSIYVVDPSTQERQRITPDKIDAIELLGINESRGEAYVIASPDNPTQRYLYRTDLAGDSWERVSPEDRHGTHSYQISPDARYAIHTWSDINSPPVVDLVSLPDHQSLRVLESNDSLGKTLRSLGVPSAKLFRVEIEPNVALDAWRIDPPKLVPGKKYPLLVYVYGEPAGTTVRDSWGGPRFMWHQMLAQQGYVVISIDNRGTPAPRGREWRKSVYRRVGINAPKDQAAAVRQVLKDFSYIDPQRVGVWGWSGGGSMSLNAIFRFPDLYKTAISVAPVPNQRYYDTIYQERYMGLPSDNVDGYREGSPITHADHLQGNLLLIHGTGDDNCHIATTEMLINKLIRLNKPFSMMSYPNRTHSIREGKNTTLHLRNLMTQYLHDHLPAGPR